MKVVEFYLKPALIISFEDLCSLFYNLGKHKRRIDNQEASSVFSVSRNPSSSWLQLLIDEDTPETIMREILRKVESISDKGKYVLYLSDNDIKFPAIILAPPERKREEIEI